MQAFYILRNILTCMLLETLFQISLAAGIVDGTVKLIPGQLIEHFVTS